jgi:two-component system, OmpR family, response regulator RegX3
MIDAEGRTVVLLVEDEASFVDALTVGLTAENFQVAAAQSLAEARELLGPTNPDVILLDVMLPDGSGVDFCREIRGTVSAPVIMVSARSDELDIVLGLEFGAADYVTKPYRLRELVARIRAVLRRATPAIDGEETVSFGDVTIDFTRRMVTKAGAEVEFSRKEFDLLSLFVSRLGQVVTRDECLDALWWGQDLTDTRTLDTHVKRLRHKIEDNPAEPTHLVTIRGVGFRLDR